MSAALQGAKPLLVLCYFSLVIFCCGKLIINCVQWFSTDEFESCYFHCLVFERAMERI